MSVRPPLFFSFSPPLLDLFSLPTLSISTWPLLLSLKTRLFWLSILSLKFWVFVRLSERLCSLLPINCAFCSQGGNQALDALHQVPCFYKKFSHLIEHLAECFHVEVIDEVQYSCTWSWVKINTLDICLGVNSPFGTSPTAPLIVLTTEHFLWCIYNQAIWDQERASNLSWVRYGGIHSSTSPLGARYKLYNR